MYEHPSSLTESMMLQHAPFHTVINKEHAEEVKVVDQSTGNNNPDDCLAFHRFGLIRSPRALHASILGRVFHAAVASPKNRCRSIMSWQPFVTSGCHRKALVTDESSTESYVASCTLQRSHAYLVPNTY